MEYAGTRDYCTCGLFYIDISGYIWHNEKENVLNKGSLYPSHSYIKFMLDKYPVFVHMIKYFYVCCTKYLWSVLYIQIFKCIYNK